MSDHGGRESPSTTPSTAKSSRRDSLTDKVVLPSQIQMLQQQQQPILPAVSHLPMKSINVPPSVTNAMDNAGSSVVMKNK